MKILSKSVVGLALSASVLFLQVPRIDTTIAASSFLETFTYLPAGQPAKSANQGMIDELKNWDITVHNREWTEDIDPTLVPPVTADHDATNCNGFPPGQHTVTNRNDEVYLCNDHLMTALHGQQIDTSGQFHATAGYGVIYMTPNHMVDFSQGSATIKFDLTTLVKSARDWVDVWISPFDDHLQQPLDTDLPDLHGVPKNAIHLSAQNNLASFDLEIIRNFTVTKVPMKSDIRWVDFLTPDAKRRDTFEIDISQSHVKMFMPGYQASIDNPWVDNAVSPALTWNKGVVQFGHHSYKPFQDCGATGFSWVGCEANTWHWDNISISPSQPFTMIKANTSFVNSPSTVIQFDKPAPSNAHLRFTGITGGHMQYSLNGTTWQQAPLQARADGAVENDSYNSYWVPIPQGTQQVQIKGASGNGCTVCGYVGWAGRSFSIWSSDEPIVTPTPSATSAQAANLTLNLSASKTSVSKGDTITYSLQLINGSSVTATSVKLTDQLPTGTSFVSASDGGTLQSGIVTWDIPSISGQTTAVRSFTVSVQ